MKCEPGLSCRLAWAGSSADTPARWGLQVKSGRPLAPDRIVAVPSGCGDADCVEDTHPCGRRMRHLNDRPRVAFIAEIDEPTPRAVTLLSHRVAGRQGPLINLVIVFRPARPMLHALMPGGQEVAVHARCATALLDELELHVSGVGQSNRDVHVVVAPTAVRESRDR